jgi:hypothetical protein
MPDLCAVTEVIPRNGLGPNNEDWQGGFELSSQQFHDANSPLGTAMTVPVLIEWECADSSETTECKLCIRPTLYFNLLNANPPNFQPLSDDKVDLSVGSVSRAFYDDGDSTAERRVWSVSGDCGTINTYGAILTVSGINAGVKYKIKLEFGLPNQFGECVFSTTSFPDMVHIWDQPTEP